MLMKFELMWIVENVNCFVLNCCLENSMLVFKNTWVRIKWHYVLFIYFLCNQVSIDDVIVVNPNQTHHFIGWTIFFSFFSFCSLSSFSFLKFARILSCFWFGCLTNNLCCRGFILIHCHFSNQMFVNVKEIVLIGNIWKILLYL